MQAILEALQDGIVATDGALRIRFANAAAQRLCGDPAATLIGLGLHSLPAFSSAAVHKAVETVLSTHQSTRISSGTALILDINPAESGLVIQLRAMEHQPEGRLQEQEALIQLIDETAGVGLWEIDLASDTVYGTPQFFRTLGLEVSNQPFPAEQIRALRVQPASEHLFVIPEQGTAPDETREIEYQVRRPDGELRWLLARGRVARDAAGKPIRLSGMNMDITERRRSEAALHESEDRFRRVFEQSPVGKATIGRDFRLREVNPALCQMLGYAPEELIGSDLMRIVHPDDRQNCFAVGHELLDGKLPMLRLEERFLRKDGTPFWVSVTVGPIRDATGKVQYSLGVIQDIDDSKRIREALEASQNRLRELNERLEQQAEARAQQLASSRAQLQSFFDNSLDWLTLQRVLPDGRIEYMDLNPASEQGYGLTRHQVVGRTVEEVLGVEAAQIPLFHLRACARTGEPQRYVARRTMAGRTRTIDVMFALVPGQGQGGERYIITAARDLTEREELEAQLRQAQKMEAVGQLTGGVAHDFNNLLSVIMGSAELARRNPSRTPSLLENILRAGERGVALTRQLLSFSRRQAAEARVLDLRAELPRIADILHPSLRGDIRLVTFVEPDVWPVEVDPNELEIALLNVTVNARDAMPDGGQLTLRISNAETNLPEAMSGAFVAITLRDTGSGIPDHVLGKVFDPFFTTKQPGVGTGLGLSQVYGFARQSGGTVTIESRLGEGTTLTIFLPRSVKTPVTGRSKAATPASTGDGRRVLLVEDNDDVGDVTAEMLQAMGLQIERVDRAEAALARIRTSRFDLLLTDVVMPDGMNGLELATALQGQIPELPILLMSGYNNVVTPASCSFRLLRKPIPFAELQDAVTEALIGVRSTAAV